MAKRRNYSRNSGGWGLENQEVSRRPRRGARYSGKRRKAKFPAALIFWAAFLVLITGLFFANRDTIRQSIEKLYAPQEEQSLSGTDRAPAEAPPLAQQPLVTAPRPIEQRTSPSSGAPAPAEPASTPTPVTAAPVANPPAGRPAESYTDRALCFIRVSAEGDIIRERVVRRIPVSGTPLQDTLDSLITGPSSGETGRDILSLIPPNTRILSAVIEGNTARISFSEEFQYNTFGPEGFIAQLIQIIWTATEFPNVQNVQILIEGNRVDHLGEGIPVWNPLDRESFNR